MIEQRALPRHIGIIMDGNGRWAQARGMPRIDGHREGARSVREIVRACREIGVGALTLYAFSEQNWARPPAEVQALMELLEEYLRDERDEIMENDIRLYAIGDLQRLPEFVQRPLQALMAESAQNTQMVLTLALSYGGRESILQAARALAADVRSGRIDPEEINDVTFQARLSTGLLPPLDLIIRTSGELRLSNFLLWEAAYAELHFTPLMWPEFRRPALEAALDAYEQRDRRFGRVPTQAAGQAGQ